MKQVIFLVLITTSSILMSCGDKNDEPANLESQLIGEWVETFDSPAELIHLSFRSDHSGVEWWTYFDYPQEKKKFDWRIDGYYLILETRNGVYVKTRFTISKGILHFDDYFNDLEFKRVE